MKFYENVFIVRQDLAPSQVDGLSMHFTKILEDLGAKVTKTEYWGLRKLAYPIKKNARGHYVLMNIESEPEALKEMERQMRISEDILRYLTTRVDALEDGPSIMMKHARTTHEDTGSEDHAKKQRYGQREHTPQRAPHPSHQKNVEEA